MNFDKYKNKGLSGLANLGNTCFINSCMQVLSHTYELNDFLNKKTFYKKLNKKVDSNLLVEWDSLRQMLWNNNCIVSPQKFINTIQNVAREKKAELFTGYAQNDVPEFLIFVIDCFHNAICREVEMNIVGNATNETDSIAVKCYEVIKQMYSKEYSEIWNMFYGIHISEIVTLATNEQLSFKPEPFFMLDLPIPEENKSPTLIDCLELYVKGEILDEENAVFNEKTKQKVAVNKRIAFWSLPNILVIDLKRFDYRNRKNQIFVDFPLENLDLSKYVVGYNRDKYIYDLYGVCNHSGSVLGGHYTACIKNANGKWYHCNDTSVQEISLVSQILSPKAYCFFYRKRKM